MNIEIYESIRPKRKTEILLFTRMYQRVDRPRAWKKSLITIFEINN
jgi:hypothetical protein